MLGPEQGRGGRSATRRQWLQTGSAGLLGLSLPQFFAAEAAANSFAIRLPKARARSVIFLFLFGGPSQFETFDMKPEAPAEIRGPFGPIGCRTPGLLISEHLPRLADISDRYCVVRTMSHTFNDHSGGGHYLQTGKRWHVPVGGGFLATPEDWPSMGSVVDYLAQREPGGLEADLPAYAVLPNWLGRLQESGQYRRPGQYGGWLGRAYDGMITKVDKRDLNDNPYWRDCSDDELRFSPEGLGPGVSLETLGDRATLLEHLEQLGGSFPGKEVVALESYRRRALALVTSDRTRAALDLRRESESLRDRYGRHLFGQSCLLARRLVEAGVRFVTVHYDCVDGYSWDSHRDSNDVKHKLLPTFDQGCSALLLDLEERGLLEETLVVAIGEMGRTPKANSNWGRDHWSTLFPALIAGGGVLGGTTFGSSDRLGTEPREDRVSPEDLAATLYWALGIDPSLQVPDALGRPIALVDGGSPVERLFTGA